MLFPTQYPQADGDALKAIVDTPQPVPVPVASKGVSPLASGASLLSIVVADMALKKAFLRAGLTFPSSLAGMVGLFAGKDGRIKDKRRSISWRLHMLLIVVFTFGISSVTMCHTCCPGVHYYLDRSAIIAGTTVL